MSNLFSGFPGNEISITASTLVGWRSPSNIALVKYWGKTGRQIPVNPSVSMTLSAAYTETWITALPGKSSNSVELDFYFEGEPNPAFGQRITDFLEGMTDVFPYLRKVKLKIETSNTFPHSSGIASSASAFSALSLCLCSLGEELTGKTIPDFFEFASHVARLGSGSAARSLYGGFTLWGKTNSLPGSDDQYAIPVLKIHPVFQNMRDAILIVNKGAKRVSSSTGHSRMADHPYSAARILQANENTEALLNVLDSGDIQSFFRIIENEALSLHALMMTSTPGFILMEPDTVVIINKIQEVRERKGLPVCFTLDAGPNVHLLYFEKDFEQVRQFIVEDLFKNDKQKKWIDDSLGNGPQNLSKRDDSILTRNGKTYEQEN
jgi:diphosphomevalonate decarboxylase